MKHPVQVQVQVQAQAQAQTSSVHVTMQYGQTIADLLYEIRKLKPELCNGINVQVCNLHGKTLPDNMPLRGDLKLTLRII